MDTPQRPSTGDPGEQNRRAGPGAWLERLPVRVVLVGVLLFVGAGLGLATIGGWTAIAAVLCWAAMMVAFVAAASG